ncbi:MAG: hypothetical protein ABIQ32_12710 [Sphingomicrobium sp.]
MSDRWVFILLLVPALVLIIRAIFSRDRAWQRVTGAMIVAMVLATVGFAQGTANAVPMIILFGAFGVAVAYLLFWAVVTRDSAVQRLGSAAAAVAGTIPILLLFKFYTE